MRSLSSEHAMIVKDQTAKAIANTATAYEKNGVEAALYKVRTEPWPREQPVVVFVSFFLINLCFFCFCVIM